MFYWLVSLAALAGVVLNIRKHVACFYIWSMTNAAWAFADWTHGLHAQAVLMSIYFFLSLWGIVKWAPGRRIEDTAGGESEHGDDHPREFGEGAGAPSGGNAC
jgi:hypothetical protein